MVALSWSHDLRPDLSVSLGLVFHVTYVLNVTYSSWFFLIDRSFWLIIDPSVCWLSNLHLRRVENLQRICQFTDFYCQSISLWRPLIHGELFTVHFHSGLQTVQFPLLRLTSITFYCFQKVQKNNYLIVDICCILNLCCK